MSQKEIKKDKAHPKTFRLMDSDVKNLKEICEKINALTPSKISETKIVRALILLGKTLKEDKIISGIKELW